MADYAIHDTTLIGISNVIRKKEGSSALIDPADYPKRINLMGMLEEKTVSSSPIVTFADGADAVPLKKCEITLPASLDGYSEVDVVATGKNLVPLTGSAVTGDLTITPQSNGTVLVNGSKTTQTVYTTGSFVAPDDISFKYSGCTGGSASTYSVNVKIGNVFGADVYNGSSSTYTATKGTTVSFVIVVRANATIDNVTFSPMIRFSTEDETFEPYNGTTHTADLGRTIYGGSVDVVNGTGEAQYGITSLDDKLYNYASNIERFDVAISEMASYGYRDDIILPSGYTLSHVLITNAANAPDMTGCVYAGKLYLKNLSCTTRAELQTALSGESLVFPLATPETFNFDPVQIDSKLGNNTIWSEQGSSAEVTYRGQGTTTPILPTLVTKTITENGTYSAEDDDADGYSEVTVNVPTGGEEIPFTHVFTAGTATDQYYTATEDGIYLAVGIRDQSTGCSINLPDGGTTLLTSSLLSNRAQMKVVQLTAGQRIHLYLYDSSHMRGGWIFKLNTTTPTLAYSNGYSSASIPNHETTDKVLSVIALAPTTDNTTIWDKTMKCYVRGTYTVSNRFSWLRLMYGIDNEMPTISFSGGIGGQWLINLG